MKRIRVLLTTLLMSLLLCACSGKQSQVPSPNYAPAEFSSFEELRTNVEKAMAEAVSAEVSAAHSDGRVASQNDQHGVDELTELYYAAWVPSDAELEVIRVKESYVAYYYTVNWNEEEYPQGRDELTSTFMFEWRRAVATESSFKTDIEQFGLSPLASEPGVYYCDIIWPGDDNAVALGRQFYWIEDGYRFSMYIPIDQCDDAQFAVYREILVSNSEQVTH